MKKIIYPFLSSITMLTKLNLPCTKNLQYENSHITNSVIYFPLIGLFFGIILYYTNELLILFNVSVLFRSLVILSIPFLMNNFFHFDGLCDMLDSFLVNKSKEQRLKILKDTNIGSFALGGAILFMLFKFAGIYSFLLKERLVSFLIIIPVFSRFMMVLLSFKSKYPRESGTASLIVGKVSLFVFLLTFLFFLLIISFFLFFLSAYKDLINNIKTIIIISIIMAVFYILFKFYSYKKIGGITGDVLGAGCEISELLIIFTLLFIDKWNI